MGRDIQSHSREGREGSDGALDEDIVPKEKRAAVCKEGNNNSSVVLDDELPDGLLRFTGLSFDGLGKLAMRHAGLDALLAGDAGSHGAGLDDVATVESRLDWGSRYPQEVVEFGSHRNNDNILLTA